MKTPRQYAEIVNRDPGSYQDSITYLFAEAIGDAQRAALTLAADHVLTQLTMAQSGMPADLILLAIDKTLRSDDFRALLSKVSP